MSLCRLTGTVIQVGLRILILKKIERRTLKHTTPWFHYQQFAHFQWWWGLWLSASVGFKGTLIPSDETLPRWRTLWPFSPSITHSSPEEKKWLSRLMNWEETKFTLLTGELGRRDWVHTSAFSCWICLLTGWVCLTVLSPLCKRRSTLANSSPEENTCGGPNQLGESDSFRDEKLTRLFGHTPKLYPSI